MCKYKISLATAFVMLLLMFCSIGYTYAYFSQKASATANLGVYKTEIKWLDESYSAVGDGNTIALKSHLKRGAYTQIQNAEKSTPMTLHLNYIEETASLPSYCRIKLTATYTNSANQTKDCSQYITLANLEGSTYTKLQDEDNWSYENGYYYYKDSTGLIKLNNEDVVFVAEYLYLDGDISADVFGASVTITLTAEVAQSANDGYKSVWGI